MSAVDVDPRGRVAYCGALTEQDHTHKAFCAIATLNGQQLAKFSTGSYVATKIVLSDDLTLWSTGFEYPALRSDSQTWHNFYVLRHYSGTGDILSEAVHNWDDVVAYVSLQHEADSSVTLRAYGRQKNVIGTFGPPTWGEHGDYLISATAQAEVYLRSADGDIDLYDGANSTFYRWSHTLAQNAQWKVGGSPPNASSTGFAVLHGVPYMSWFSRARLTMTTSLTELVFDRHGFAHWKVVEEDTTPLAGSQSSPRRLLGTDQGKLVLAHSVEAANSAASP